MDFTARDLQAACRRQGAPWEVAKAFDNSAAISDFIDISSVDDELNFSLSVNGNVVQSASASDMIFSIDRIISHISKYITLKIGDLIYTGTPAGVGRVHIGDRLQGFIGNRLMFDFVVK